MDLGESEEKKRMKSEEEEDKKLDEEKDVKLDAQRNAAKGAQWPGKRTRTRIGQFLQRFLLLLCPVLARAVSCFSFPCSPASFCT